jgi:hypothetical protein
MDENTGAIIYDAKNGLTGSTGSGIWTTGKNNGAIKFDNSALASVDSSSYLNLATNFAISCWVYFTGDTVGGMYLVVRENVAGVSQSYRLLASLATGYLDFSYYAGGSLRTVSTTGIVGTGSWIHIVGTYKSTVGGRLYVNGGSVNSLATTGTLGVGTQPLYIGNESSGSYGLRGIIDELAIWSGTWLTQSHVTTLYNAGSGIYY